MLILISIKVSMNYYFNMQTQCFKSLKMTSSRPIRIIQGDFVFKKNFFSENPKL